MATKTKKNVPKKQSKKSKESNFRLNSDGKRVRKVIKHKSFALTKKTEIKKVKPLGSIKELFKTTNKMFLSNKKIFFGLGIFFAFLTFLFVKGLGSSFSLVSSKSQIIDLLGGNGRDLDTTFTLFSELLSSTGTNIGDVASAYQLFFSIITILATLWIIRRIFNNEPATVKSSYYQGMYPLIPFILVTIVVVLQLLPATFGNFLLSTVLTNGLAVTALEKFLWILVYVGLNILSVYMILSSIFGLIIVTLDGLTPMTALRSAREIVLHRRLKVLARIIVLIFMILLIYILLFVPLIIYAPVLAEPIFLIVGSFTLIYTVGFFYNLYRQLL